MPRKIGRPPGGMRRPQPAQVGSTALEPVGVPPAQVAPRKKRSVPQGLGINSRAVLHDPAPPRTILARRERRASQPELDEVLGAAPVQGKRETQFNSYHTARGIGPAPPAGVPQQ
jgi:hypothetical protein